MAAFPRPDRLPPAAKWGLADALAIAASPKALRESFDYWNAQFGKLGVDPFGAAGDPALTFSRQLSDDPLRRAAAADWKMDKAIKAIGCMLSTREIAVHIARISEAAPPFVVTPTIVFEFLRAFKAAATAKAPVVSAGELATVARGLIAAREIFDVARRYAFCFQADSEVTTAEALALFRQEGGLALTPPAESLPHAPVILTGSGCRNAAVTIDDRERRAERPGYNLVFRRTAEVSPVPLSFSIEGVLMNLLIVGGLDSIINSKATKGDELREIFENLIVAPVDAAGAEIGEVLGKKLRGLQRTQTVRVLNAMGGFAMLELDEKVQLPLPELLGHAWLEMSRLIDAHPCVEMSPGGDIHLSNSSPEDDSFTCLRVQKRWYKSRMRLETILPRRDRHPVEPPLPTLSPFLTYLRFHSGDAIFMGLLLRFVARLDAFASKKSIGPRFKAAYEAARSTWDTRAKSEWPRHRALLERYEKIWIKKVVATPERETVWRHVGLIKELKTRTKDLTWIKDAQSDELEDIGRIATQVITTIHSFRLFPVLERLFYDTPITALFRLVPNLSDKWKNVFAKAHTFEALRAAYAAALAKPDPVKGN